MSDCKSCGAPILWVKIVPAARAHPLDLKPSTGGNVRMVGERVGVARVLSKLELEAARALGELLYTSHFATCPNAGQHRKARA